MRRRVRAFRELAFIVALMLLAGGVAHARTKRVTGTVGGTGVTVPLDLDNDSCFIALNGATVCTDSSAYVNKAGKSSDSGSFTAQGVFEAELVPGTGCNIGGTPLPFAGCTLAAVANRGAPLSQRDTKTSIGTPRAEIY